MRSRRSALLIGAIALLASAGAVAAPEHAGAAGPVVCSGVTAPTVSSVAKDTGLNSMFTNYGNTGAGWTGADSTWSAKLPDGRDLWMYSDPFLWPITAPPRPSNAILVSTAFVSQSGSSLSTIYGGTHASPAAVIRPATAGHWYWLGDGTAVGNPLPAPGPGG